MSGKGKRRSARLLKLEEQKNDDDDTAAAAADSGPAAVCLLDPWQIIRNSITGATRGKRKRNDEIQRLQQGEASCSQAADATTRTEKHLANKGSTGQIIEYILDMLELRDTHELFAMPDDIQIVDYAERVNRPGDFATLRQKNTDGMYKTLEQFENDVYMVFQKAMSINSQDTVPYKEATSLLEQAKQVFVSLKSNQMYSEPELLAWRQKHLDAAGPSKPAREQGANNDDVHAAAAAAATPAQQRPSVTPAKKKAVVAEKRPQVIKAGNASADKSRAKPRAPREGKTTPGTGKRARKAPATATATAEASGGARVAKRRLTYDEETDRGRGTTTPATPAKIRERHATLLYVQGHTYQDSLRRFVRHAGLKARVAAEFRSLECETRARQHSPSTPQSSSYWSGLSGGGAFSPGTSAGGGYYRSYYPGPSSPATAATSSSAGGAPQPPECKLETDGLLRLVMLVGTPAFLERAKQAFGDLTRREGSCSKEEEQQQQRAAAGAGDEAKAIVAVTAGPAQRSTGGASDQGPVDFGPFAPPKLVPGRLGFGQFAGTSGRPFKLKPPPSKFPGRKKRE